ncbi:MULTISPECIES: FecCD family ABC transporter permease [Cytobacillus]|uniref:Iron ABC transporter permease n=1 Tax=Cytobacillus stercorigallinarum TaxID=2762240 RepID=A0ABR8QSC0_9BACI|nr:iron ABC transporter permease [Cytobacillus stercorigallinarum]MBD7938449.1 iron ABC transporter permease [Cytobacillus stercorigallinarum]
MRKTVLIAIVLSILILVSAYVSLVYGVINVNFTDVINTLFRIDPSDQLDLVIFDFRLPRIVIGALVGFGLGIAGTVIQGVTRNGLADSGILGINAGAGAAIVIFMLFFQGQMDLTGWLSIMIMPIFGLIGGILAAFIIFFFSWQKGTFDTGRLILTGIAISSGFGALSMYISLKMNSSDYEMAAVWVSGSIYNANWIYIISMIPWLVILIPLILRKSYLLDLFRLSDISSKGVGVPVEREKIKLIILSIGLISACVSVSGNISFIGLMAPHIARQLVGMKHQFILPISGLIGMFLVVIADFVAKNVFTPVELPVGIVISMIGVPYFLYLLVKQKQ